MVSQKSNNSGFSDDTKTLLTVLALVFIFPAGVILMWVWTSWSKWIKILITLIPLVITFLVFLLIGFIFSHIPKDAWKTNTSYSFNSTSSEPTSSSSADTTNWKTYIDPTFGYSFKYPVNFKSLPNLGDHVFYSPDSRFDKTTRAKTKGLEIGSTVYGPGEDIQNYIGPNTKVDAALISKLALSPGLIAKAYVNTEDITVTIDYKQNNKNMRIMIWCGGENGNSSECKDLLTPVLSTFKFTN